MSDTSCQSIKLINGSSISYNDNVPEEQRLKGSTPPPIEINLISYLDYIIKNNNSHTKVMDNE